MKCSICNSEDSEVLNILIKENSFGFGISKYMMSCIHDNMKNGHLCFRCAYWMYQSVMDLTERPWNNIVSLIINHQHYTLLDNPNVHYDTDPLSKLVLKENGTIYELPKYSEGNIPDIFFKEGHFKTNAILLDECDLTLCKIFAINNNKPLIGTKYLIPQQIVKKLFDNFYK